MRQKAVLAGKEFFQDSLLVNGAYLFGLNVVGALGGFGLWLFAAKFYPTSEVGLASAIISIILLLAEFATLGLGTGLIRFLASAKNPVQMINTSFTFICLTTLMMGGIYLMGLHLWSPTLLFLRQGVDLVIGFLLFLLLMSFNSVFPLLFQACLESQYAFWQALAMHILRLVLIFPLVSVGALGIVAATGIGALLATLLGFFIFLPLVIPSYQFRPQYATKVIKLLIPYSFANQMADLLYRAPLLLTPLLVLEMLNAQFSAYAYIGWMFGFLLAIPGITLATSAFAEGSHAPQNMRPILFRAAQFGITLTILLAMIIGFGAPLILSVFGESYATETTSLLRWLAVAAPFVVVNSLYFSMLRIQKRIGRLILLTALSATFSLAIPLFTLQEIGLVSTGIGWLVAQVLVTLVAGWWHARRYEDSRG